MYGRQSIVFICRLLCWSADIFWVNPKKSSGTDSQGVGTVCVDAGIVYEGRKYIAFTDSRQGSARSAMGMNQDVERSWIRASIFTSLLI